MDILRGILKPLLKIIRRGTPLEKRLLRNHLAAVMALILATAGVFLVQRQMLSAQQDAALLVNTSGKQRMTSQKLFRYLFESAGNPTRRDQGAALEAYAQMMDNHALLLEKLLDDHRSISFQDKEINALYFGDRGLDMMVKNFRRHFEAFPVCCATFRQVETLLDSHGAVLLNRFEEAVEQYQLLSERRIARLMWVEETLAFLMIMLIILEGFFIFRPAIIEVYRENLFLNRHRLNLERRVRREVRIRQEQERILVQKAKLAEMGEMLNNIAHQWKQPLNILSLAAGDIQDEMDKCASPHLRESLEELFVQIRFMSKTIDNFRNFYQPDRRPQLFNPAEAIASVAQILERELKQKRVRVEISGEKAASVEGYENEFKQIVLNLLNNAKDAICEARREENEHEGVVRFELRSEGEKLIVTATDNGPGVPEAVREKIFNPYFSTKQERGGTGIGLYMIRTILERHFGGDIRLLETEAGNGAGFELTLCRRFTPRN